MSSINPNNIDGTYPIAGQDNDSQGFRDNFTNIKNNFTFSKTEIEDLQSKVILKSALSGTTLDNNLNNAQLKGAQILRQTETRNDLGALNSTVTVNWTDAHFQTVETTGSITLDFDQWPTSGFWTSLKLQVDVTNVSHTLTLPSEVSENVGDIAGITGQVITFPSVGLYLFEFSTYDGGTTVQIRDLRRNYDTGFTSNTATLVTANVTGTTGNSLTVNSNASIGNNLYVDGNLRVANLTGGATSLGLTDATAINNTPIGNATPSSGAFTTLDSTGATSLGLTDATAINSTPIGNATPASGAFTTLSASGNLTVASGYVPASNTAPGTAGQIVWDSGNVYVCIATDTWMRAALTSTF